MKKYKNYKSHLNKYIKENLNKGYTIKTIEKALKVYGYDPNFVDNLIKTYKLKNIPVKFISFLVVLIATISIVYFTTPSIVGYTTTTKSFNFTDEIDLIANESGAYLWDLANKGKLISVKLNGAVKTNGLVRIYLEYENNSYLILDNNKLEEKGLEEITGFDVKEKPKKDEKEQNESEKELINVAIVNEIMHNETKNTTQQLINKSIAINLEYKFGTPYDIDDDGIEAITGVIDLTVENSNFSWDVNKENLCTRWGTYSIEDDKITTVCHGSSKCCNFIELAPKRENWSDILYSTYGQYDASLNNIISAQVIYIDYNLSIDEPFAEIYYSSWHNLTAKFYEEFIKVENICIETCILPNLNATSYKLKFEIDNSSFVLDSISYEILLNETINNAPVLIKNLSGITIFIGQNHTINLSEYFYDDDNDTLFYNLYNNREIGVVIANNTAILIPSSNFTGAEYVFFTSNDNLGTAISNVFKVEVKERVKEPEERILKSLRRIIALT